jgi:stalled ribosome rescue protein Dom34
MSAAFHMTVWLDHTRAHIYQAFRDRLELLATIEAPDIAGNIHHKAGTRGSGHARPARSYLESITLELSKVRHILITGPAEAKTALWRYLEKNAPSVAAFVLAVLPLGDPDNRELVEKARSVFHHAELMKKD